MLKISSHVHFTPLKKMGYAGIIIALEQHGVRVKENDGKKKLCKRWCVMNKRKTLRQTTVHPFPPLWFIFTKGSCPV